MGAFLLLVYESIDRVRRISNRFFVFFFQKFHFSGIEHHHVVDFYAKCRDVCIEYFRRNRPTFGGPGIRVQCDETYFTRAHGGKGRRVRQHSFWVFGIVEHGMPASFNRQNLFLGSNLSWFTKVAQRNAPTLKRLIQKYVRPHSSVETDLWAAYQNMPQLPQQYNHLVVNHSINFVDPITGANTQTVESKNGQVKEMVRRKHGIHERVFTSHLREFAWRERFGKRKQVFYHFWHQVATFYPCSN